MQFVGLSLIIIGYAAGYKLAQEWKRPPGAHAGSYAYYLLGVTSLGAPSGYPKPGQPATGPAATAGATSGGHRGGPNQTAPGHGPHSRGYFGGKGT